MANIWRVAITLVICGIYLLTVMHSHLQRKELERQAEDAHRLVALAEASADRALRTVDEALALHLGTLSTSSGMADSLALRDYLYTRTVVGQGGGFDTKDPAGQILRMAREPIAMECGGLAQAYVWMLKRLDIAARPVQLATSAFVEGKAFTDTHVSVEVFDASSGHFYVSDPTFNVSFSCGDDSRLLGFEGLKACVDRGERIRPVRNGRHYVRGRTVETYYMPYERLLHAMRARELEVGSGVRQAALDVPYPHWLGTSLQRYITR